MIFSDSKGQFHCVLRCNVAGYNCGSKILSVLQVCYYDHKKPIPLYTAPSSTQVPASNYFPDISMYSLLNDNKKALIKEFVEWLTTGALYGYPSSVYGTRNTYYGVPAAMIYIDNVVKKPLYVDKEAGLIGWWGSLQFVIREFQEDPSYGILVHEGPLWSNRTHGLWPCRVFTLFTKFGEEGNYLLEANGEGLIKKYGEARAKGLVDQLATDKDKGEFITALGLDLPKVSESKEGSEPKRKPRSKIG